MCKPHLALVQRLHGSKDLLGAVGAGLRVLARDELAVGHGEGIPIGGALVGGTELLHLCLDQRRHLLGEA